MHDIKKIDVQEGILDENDHIAAHVKEHMTEHGILVVNEMGGSGCRQNDGYKKYNKTF